MRGQGCVSGEYFRVVAKRMLCSYWKTGGLSPGGVQEDGSATLGQHDRQG